MYGRTAEVFAFPAWAVSVEQQSGMLLTASVLAVLAAAYALWWAYRQRDPFPIFVFLGAGFAVLYEPLGDILTKVAYPPLEQVSLMTSFGRPTPLWMAPNYFFFISVPVLLLLQFVVRQGVSQRKWWLTYAGLALFVGLFEQPGINAASWRYYGAQAFSINTYPVWVAFANSAALLMVAVGVALLRRTVITPSLSFLFVLLVPMLFAGVHLGSGLPVMWAIYTTGDALIINAAAILTIAMCLLTAWLGLKLINGQAAGRG